MTDLDKEDLLRRAFAAWFRSGAEYMQYEIPEKQLSSVQEKNGRFYVVLRNPKFVNAVYRVRNDGVLRGLRLWPSEFGKGVSGHTGTGRGGKFFKAHGMEWRTAASKC